MAVARRNARTARFRTVLVLADPGGTETVVDGVAEGVIVDEPRGEGGFGYDPVFAPAGGGGRTFAEMTLAEKQRISHRGRALRTLAARLREAGATPSPSEGE
jgi:XTP/dITP diphosphohydrolase